MFCQRDSNPERVFAVKKQSGGLFFSKKVRSPVPKCKAFGWTSRQDASGGCVPEGVPEKSIDYVGAFFNELPYGTN